MDPYRSHEDETQRSRTAKLVPVWTQMAEHFLDTDNRDLIPRTAAVCVDAGLEIAKARDVWRYDVAPALAANLWTSGEWLGWDDARLVARIEEYRARWDNELPWRWISYWATASSVEPTWRAIARVMRVLKGETDAGRRQQLADDLSRLARMYFSSGMLLGREKSEAAIHRTRLAPLYHQGFRRLVAPVMPNEKAEYAHRCVLFALDEGPAP